MTDQSRVLIIGDPAHDRSGTDFEEEFRLRGIDSVWCAMGDLLGQLSLDGMTLAEHASKGLPVRNMPYERIVLSDDCIVPTAQYAVLVNSGGFPLYMDAAMAVFERSGLVSPNSAESARVAGDKWLTYERLRDNDVPTPKTKQAVSADEAVAAAHALGYPVVIKDPLGSQGSSVWLARSETELEALLPSLDAASKPLLVQHYVECNATDKRIVFVDGEFVFGLQRTAKAGDFRSNTSLGGDVSVGEVADAEIELGLRVAEALQLRYAKLDIAQVAAVLPGREYLPAGSFFCVEANAMGGLVRFDHVIGVSELELRQNVRRKVADSMLRVAAPTESF